MLPDDRVEQAIEAILNSARTGKIGDGKIFVFDVNQVVHPHWRNWRIRRLRIVLLAHRPGRMGHASPIHTANKIHLALLCVLARRCVLSAVARLARHAALSAVSRPFILDFSDIQTAPGLLSCRPIDDIAVGELP